MKIKVIIDSKQASKHHRLSLPFKEIAKDEQFNIEFIEGDRLTDEVCSGADVVIYNWCVINNAWEIGAFKKKYPNLKIIHEIDDFWQFSEVHPVYSNKIKAANTAKMIKMQLFEADAVICSTDLLKEHILNINKNTFVAYNSLNIGIGQWVANKPERKLLHVGIYGSVTSHYGDYLQLKSIINRLAKNKQIAENCKFVLCGVNESPYWAEIIKFFEVKKNLQLEIVPGTGFDNYMRLLDNLDVCLIPLEEIDYNFYKSSLKILECSIANVVPVGSSLYLSKEMTGILAADSPVEYEKWVVGLLDREKYEEALDYTKSLNFSKNDWEGRINTIKDVLKTLKRAEIDKENLEVYSIVYENGQIGEFKEYDNSWRNSVEKESYLFEHAVYREILEKNGKFDYLGIFSHKFGAKTGLSKKMLYAILDQMKYTEYDVINCCRKYSDLDKDYLGWSYKFHDGLKDLLEPLCEDLGLRLGKVNEVIYSNQFIAKKEVYKDFVDKVLNPAIELMTGKYKELAFKDAKYNTRKDNPQGLPPEKLKEKTGMEFYPVITFALERLFSIYLLNNPSLKVKSIF